MVLSQRRFAAVIAWISDKAVYLLVFIGGISAIVFILSVFTLITEQGDEYSTQENLDIIH